MAPPPPPESRGRVIPTSSSATENRGDSSRSNARRGSTPIYFPKKVQENPHPCLWCTYYMLAFPSSQFPALDDALGRGVVCAHLRGEDGARCLRCRYCNPHHGCLPVPEAVLELVLELVKEHKVYVRERYGDESEKGLTRIARKLQLLMAPALRDHLTAIGMLDLLPFDWDLPMKPLREGEAAKIVAEIEARLGPVCVSAPQPPDTIVGTRSDAPLLPTKSVNGENGRVGNGPGISHVEGGGGGGRREFGDINGAHTDSTNRHNGKELNSPSPRPTAGTSGNWSQGFNHPHQASTGGSGDDRKHNSPNSNTAHTDRTGPNLKIPTIITTKPMDTLDSHDGPEHHNNLVTTTTTTPTQTEEHFQTPLEMGLDSPASSDDRLSGDSDIDVPDNRDGRTWVGLLSEYYYDAELEQFVNLDQAESVDGSDGGSEFMMSGALPPDNENDDHTGDVTPELTAVAAVAGDKAHNSGTNEEILDEATVVTNTDEGNANTTGDGQPIPQGSVDMPSFWEQYQELSNMIRR